MTIQRNSHCIIFIFLMEYALSHGTCNRDTCLGQFRFGQSLPRSTFTTKYKLSPYQCAIECYLRRQRCKSFNYRRPALSCQLCEEDSGPEGINLQNNPGCDHSNINTWENMPVEDCIGRNCSWTERCDFKGDTPGKCVKTECSYAVLKPGVIIEPANETAVGTKARYRCLSKDMERGSYLTTCLESTAEWSVVNFTCVCTHPPMKSDAINETVEVEVGKNYTYKCLGGLLGQQNLNPTITCLQDGSWTSTNFNCVTQNWIQDKLYPNNTHQSKLIKDYIGMDLMNCMYECDKIPNQCLSFFHDNNTGLCILSSSFQRGLPESFQFCNGCIYYTAPLTSCDVPYGNITLDGFYYCIMFHSELKTFEEAMEVCESEKAKLLVVTTEAHVTYLKNRFTYYAVFTGATDTKRENYWVKWTGDEVSSFWDIGQPNGQSSENCGVIASWWNGIHDISCYLRYNFFCQRYLVPSVENQ